LLRIYLPRPTCVRVYLGPLPAQAFGAMVTPPHGVGSRTPGSVGSVGSEPAPPEEAAAVLAAIAAASLDTLTLP
jgi:hypothetical protein